MRIVTDTATLYSPEEGKQLGITVVPACAVIDGENYKDFEDITSEEFLKKIEEGGVPTSSQPAIGDVIDIFEESDEELLWLSIGDGLSGTYQSTVGIKNTLENNEYIHIVDTKTLAGPQRYLVQKALQLRDEGLNMEHIKNELARCIETSVSFVIPSDFNFLKRSGRLTPIAAKLVQLIKIVPVLTQTEDKRRIEPFVIKRTKKKAIEAIVEYFKSLGMDESYLVTISHGGAYESAKEVVNLMKQQFTKTTIELFQLSPALITHGGPGCIVVQAIKK